MNSNNFIVKLFTEKIEIGIEIKDQPKDIMEFATQREQLNFVNSVAHILDCAIMPILDLSPESKCMNFTVKGLDSDKYYDIMHEFQKKFGSKFEVGRNYFRIIY